MKHALGLILLGLSLVATPAAAQDPVEPVDDAGTSAEGSPDTGAAQEAPEPAQEDAPPPPPEKVETGVAAAEPKVAAHVEDADDLGAKTSEKKWDIGFTGYFRAPMTLAISNRPGPDDLTGEPRTQISYGPNRTVDSNYYSFAYTRLQERDWMEVYVQAKREHVQATIGWMGYWFAGAGFRNPDAAWLPGIAYVTLYTDFQVAGIKPNVALSVGSWWPGFGRFDKYDTFTLGQYRQLGEQIKLTLPFTEDFTTTVVQGFGTGRDGSFNYGAPPPYQDKVGLNLLEYAHLQFNYKQWIEIGLHHNMQWTRDPNLFQQTSAGKSYSNARDAELVTWGGEVKVAVPRAGSLWVSPSYVTVKNGWALGEAGVEVVHALSPEGLAVNYLGWSGSPSDSTGSGSLFNLGFLYENKLSTLLGKVSSAAPDVTLNVFGLLVDASLDRPEGSVISQNKISQFKWGADVEYNPVKWAGIMARWDEVNYDLNNPGYIFSAITGRLSLYSDFLSGERLFFQYSRYRYGDNMTLAGAWPWGVPLVAGSEIIQGGPYAGSKPDMDVIKVQADIKF
jgi:hypothetical protein